MSDPDLNALIGSRICHDLISPLGAIGNGVELLNMAGMASGPEMALISESVENANARIRFFRVAFGAASAEARVGRSEILSILDGMYRAGRMNVVWSLAGDHPRRLVKQSFLALQCVESALTWGGDVTLSGDAGRITIQGKGERIKFDEALWHLATGHSEAADLAASDVHFALLPLTSAQNGRPVEVDAGEDFLRVSF